MPKITTRRVQERALEIAARRGVFFPLLMLPEPMRRELENRAYDELILERARRDGWRIRHR